MARTPKQNRFLDYSPQKKDDPFAKGCGLALAASGIRAIHFRELTISLSVFAKSLIERKNVRTSVQTACGELRRTAGKK